MEDEEGHLTKIIAATSFVERAGDRGSRSFTDALVQVLKELAKRDCHWLVFDIYKEIVFYLLHEGADKTHEAAGTL